MVDVLIVGAGMAGLNCARILHQHGRSFKILEKTDRIGGRVGTDAVDGFRLDRGFQTLLSAYPEARAALDYEALDLHPLADGAIVRFEGAFHKLMDPVRHPLQATATFMAPIGTLSDKMGVASLRSQLVDERIDDIMARDEMTIDAALRERWGFSDSIIERFFRPFLGGVMLDASLGSSSRMFEFVFRMFSRGQAVLPSNGMQAIPDQIANQLPQQSIRLNATAIQVSPGEVTLESGQTLRANTTVIATEAPEAATLTQSVKAGGSCSTLCLYFATEEPPISEPMLVLNGDGEGLINSMVVPSNVAPGYAPDGQALVSVSVLGNPLLSDDDVKQEVVAQLQDWYGSTVTSWRHLATYRITYGLPDQTPPFLDPPAKPVRLENGLYACGDYLDTASINGALAAGRRAAEAILSDFG